MALRNADGTPEAVNLGPGVATDLASPQFSTRRGWLERASKGGYARLRMKTPLSTIRRSPEDRRATGYSKCWRRRRDLFGSDKKGLPKLTSARMRQLLKELAAAGTIRVRTSSTGSRITLVDGGRA